MLRSLLQVLVVLGCGLVKRVPFNTLETAHLDHLATEIPMQTNDFDPTIQGGRFGSRCYVRPLFKWPKINGISLLFGVVIPFITGFWAHLVGKTWVGLLLRVWVF